MDSRLLSYYERELQYIREMGGEFAREYPKIAGRLGVETLECADPYVERLLEGFAFLAARVQLKLDGETPRFTQHLLELVYPHYLCQTPSSAIVRMEPDLEEGALAEGVKVERGTTLRTVADQDGQTQCQYTTTQDVSLWPLEIIDAEYFSREVTSLAVPDRVRGGSAGLRIRFQTTAGLKTNEVKLDNLCLYLSGPDDVPVRLYEQLTANSIGAVLQPVSERASWQAVLEPSQLRPLGFDDEQALLPFGPRSFSGYRLLREYFTLPQKYMFVELSGLQQHLSRHDGDQWELMVIFDRSDSLLDRWVDAKSVQLHCTPAVNLFPHRADSIHLSDRHFEHHVIPDRARPLDFEVFDVTSVVGRGMDMDEDQIFRPFYSMTDSVEGEEMAYYTLHRTPRVVSSQQKRRGQRSSYTGSEAFLSLVDGKAAPYHHNLQMLSVDVLCTNRDLPLQIPIGVTDTDFTLDTGAPVSRIKCVSGPTTPGSSLAHARGELLWRLVNHLSLNYLSLVDTDSQTGAVALRELLEIYSPSEGSVIEKQISGIRTVSSQGITRQLPTAGPIAFGRGVEITLELDESAFKGLGCFLIGAILEQFFSRYVSINSFTETVLRTTQRGEIRRWPARIGKRHLI
ncbi:MAG: type VI secretion system baseplate subunit TssF [Planctomycetota bacterium]